MIDTSRLSETADRTARRVNAALIRAADVLADAYLRGAQRRRLMELSDLGLRDIGISRAEAWAEYRKPFWRG